MTDCSNEWAPYHLSIATCAISSLIAVVSIASNVVVLVAFVKDPLKKLHTPFNHFLINLSFSDLFIGFVVMPISITTHYWESQRTINLEARYAIRISYLIAATGSTLSILALSVDRFAAIKWPIKYRAYRTFVKCLPVSCGVWVLAITLPFLYFAMGYRNYLMLHANISLVLGIGFLFAIYIRVYLHLRSYTQELQKTMPHLSPDDKLRRLLIEKKVTRTFLVILLTYVVTYLPAVVLIYVIFFCRVCTCDFIHTIRDAQFLLVASNRCVNAFVFTWRLKDFKRSIKIIFAGRYKASSDAANNIKEIQP